eukprot:1160520-Pelagomonas_calceolata.AAC.5
MKMFKEAVQSGQAELACKFARANARSLLTQLTQTDHPLHPHTENKTHHHIWDNSEQRCGHADAAEVLPACLPPLGMVSYASLKYMNAACARVVPKFGTSSQYVQHAADGEV